jgi:uncharacterized protein YjdB
LLNKEMKKMLKLKASMLAIATLVLLVASCKDDENNETAPVAGVKSLTVNPAKLYLEVDSTKKLTVTLEPADAPNESLIWSSYNRDIATVRSTGGLTAEVTGVSIGTTLITIVTSNDKRITCEVTVSKSVPLVAITVRPNDSLHLEPGESRQLVATQGPANATNYNPVWTSSNPEVATVEDGLVAAVGAGEATVTVTSGNISKSIEVQVTDPLTSITILQFSQGELLHLTEIGNTRQLTATPVPEKSRGYNPVWTSTDPNVATVEDGLVTAVGLGRAIIIVASGDISDSVNVRVTSAYLSDLQLEENISISTGEVRQINVAPVPETAENYVLNWTSDDPSVARVSDDGELTGVSAGITTITVTSGSIQKSVPVFVDVAKYSTAGWTIESRGGNYNWRGDGGDVDGAGQAWCVLDGDRSTGWHSALNQSLPQCLVVDMKASKSLHRVVIWHLPNGLQYNWLYYNTIEIYLSNSPVVPNERQDSWGAPIGVHNYTGGYDPVSIDLTPNSQGQYLIILFPDGNNGPYMSFAELDVIGN